MKKLGFYTGRANSGHKEALYASAVEKMRSGADVIFIVAEQATFEAESRLSETAGGLIGLQVLSFERLAERVLAETGRKRPYLNDQGVAMVTRRVAQKYAGELKVFSRAVGQTGFCTQLAELFGELKRAMIAPEELTEKAPLVAGSSLMRDKLADIALLYAKTQDRLSQTYMTEDDGINAAIGLIPCSFVRGADVLIDFDGLRSGTGQFEEMFFALLSASAGVTCSVTLDPEAPHDPLFAPAQEVKTRLSLRARELGIEVYERPFSPDTDRPEALRFAESTVFRPGTAAFSGDIAPLQIRSCSNGAQEAGEVADRILALAMEGIRYREMAVLVSDAAAYLPLLKRSFFLRGIPLFADEKRKLTSFTAVDTLIAALRCAAGAYRAADMIRLAKSGYAGVDRSGAEALENYCLRYGIRGGEFTETFTRGTRPPKDGPKEEFERELLRIEEADRARALLIGPLEELKAGLRAHSAGEKLKAVCAYLEKIGLREALTKTAEALVADNRPRAAEEHAGLWRMLTETLDQFYAILGDVSMSMEDFLSVMEEGLSSEMVRIVPDTVDRVLIGDAMHTVPGRGVRVLFVLGASEGMLPKDRHDDGLLSNSELKLMDRSGLRVGAGTGRMTELDRYTIYLALSAPSERLILSYSMTVDGQESLMSGFVKQLSESAGLPPVSEMKETAAEKEPVSERMGFRMLADRMREQPDASETRAFSAYFGQSPEYGAHTALMEKLSKGLPSPDPLDRALAQELFRANRPMSASRLEGFNNCPFRHFVDKGLGVKLRKECGMRSTDLGTFYHAVLEQFVRLSKERGIDVGALTDEEADALVDEVIPGVLRAFGDGMLVTDTRLRAELFLYTDNAKFTVRALVRQIAAGGFRPAYAEAPFKKGGLFPPLTLKLDDGRTVTLEGIVDRIDSADTELGRLYRVVDYKTAGRNMDYTKIAAGLHLQLPLYLSAVADADANAVAGGMYYMKIQPSAMSETKSEELFDQFALTGITLDDPECFSCTAKDPERIFTVLKKEGRGVVPACSQSLMRAFLKSVRETAAETAKRMLDGEIAISPAPKSCEYCDFRSVCGFDPKLENCRERSLVNYSRSSYLGRLEQEGNKS